MTYFDSCYLAKLYLNEPDSPAVRAHAEAAGDLVCCLIGWAEVVAALHRSFRENRITSRELRLLAGQVGQDLKSGIWTPLPVTQTLVESLSQRVAKLPGRTFLRATDAIHLTCAAEAGLKEIFSSDRHLVSAAPHFGLRAVTL